MKKIIYGLLIFVIIFIIAYFIYSKYYNAGEIYVLSVSTDGNYAITTDGKRMAILWDLKNHKKKILDRTANIYSAYFIKNSDNFMWQHDTDNEVIIENVSGKVVKKFNPGFPTYGQIITSNLNNYFASDEKWNIYYSNDDSTINKISKGFLSFLGSGKLLNWTFSKDHKYVLSSGDGGAKLDDVSVNKPKGKENLNGVVLWDTKTGKPLMKYPGNVAQTIATLSPDGKYVVAGDVNIKGFVWNTATGEKLFRLWNIFYGKPIKRGQDGIVLKSTTIGLIKVPEDFRQYDGGEVYAIYSLKFIDKTHYLRFTTYVPNYAILYKVTDPKPLKYLKFGKPDISVDRYTRDQSIDTSPSAHILVTGKINSGGILVYKYDPETQTLTKIWNGK